MEKISEARQFGGTVESYKHSSSSTKTEMKFSIYRPPQAKDRKVPVLYWLSGLTCTDENFTVKAGAQRVAAEKGLLLVMPDTSPRGANLPGEDDGWDFGTGAGFYVNATQEPWSKHYKMYDYVTKELPALVNQNLPVDPSKTSISGHSMGGHGAIVCALTQPGTYRSVSAFAPICAPTLCPWGEKAFSNYLGCDRKAWEDYDSHLLVQKTPDRIPMLIDQGTADNFLKEQLMPEKMIEACHSADYPVDLRMQEGYDHSYYFISTFIGDHLEFHAKHMGL